MAETLILGIHPVGPFESRYEANLPLELFREALDLANQNKINAHSDRQIEGGSLLIRCDPKHPALIRIMELVRLAGYQISPEYVRLDSPRQMIPGRIIRTYKDSELDAFRFLTIYEWGKHWLADSKAGTSSVPLIADVTGVGRKTKKGWDQEIGVIGNWDYYVHPSIRAAFEKAGLKGLGYEALCWDKPQKAKHDYWRLTPTIMMPTSLVPVVTIEDRCIYQDGPFEPQELRYKSADVDVLGEFDIAFAREDIGIFGKPGHGNHLLVVSQRFRQVCKGLGLAVKFNPVHLDAPPPELPWFFHSDKLT